MNKKLAPQLRLNKKRDPLPCLAHKLERVVLQHIPRECSIITGLFEAPLAIGADNGFYFIGNAAAETDFAYGFIPFGETEIMIDADGQKFLIVRSEE